MDPNNGWIDAINSDEKIRSQDGFQTVAVCSYPINQWTKMPETVSSHVTLSPKFRKMNELMRYQDTVKYVRTSLFTDEAGFKLLFVSVLT